MAPTPLKSNQSLHPKTPQSKHRLNFNVAKPSPNPNSTVKEVPPAEHPVEVVGRIRDHPDRKEKPASALQINTERHSLRVKTEIGYRDFTLDGVSLSEEEDLDTFYKKFVGSRINGVKLGDKCTVMMYGPTGSGKSHTMFGCPKQPGIVYRSLKDILGERDEEGEDGFGIGTFVQVSVLEIYNEEIYDLLSTNSGGGLSFGWPKGSASKVRLEVMGKKAKNATFISGTEAAKISKEIQKVEKRRIVRSTLCNERSSRSHCMIILDVPTVGGRLMLVDMAGSENIEQAGQNSLEAKMQTGKINQGNIALKRVVESIANGDSHVPFRDSKLTMLLQDSFEDDKSKILMILCASPDPKEMHKTISTLEYGAKAKCIVRGPHTPIKDRNGTEDPSSALMMGSRIAAMDQFIFKLQMENKQREKERNEAHKALVKKEEEVSALREKLSQAEGKEMGTSEEEINLKVNERVQMLKSDLEKKVRECERMAHEFVELERRKMEETIKQQQQEVEMLKRRLEEIELELVHSRGGDKRPSEVDGFNFAKKLLDAYADEDPGMVKSMDLDRSMDFDNVRLETSYSDNSTLPLWNPASINMQVFDNHETSSSPLGLDNLRLSTVFEEAEEEQEKSEDEEVQKEVIEEKTVYSSSAIPSYNFSSESFASSPQKFSATSEHDNLKDGAAENDKDLDSSRMKRIQTIFTLCGNYRELSQHNGTPNPVKVFETTGCEDSTVKRSLNKVPTDSKENYDMSGGSKIGGGGGGDLVDVHVKWEASKDHPGKAITSFKVEKGATLADLRKLIEKQAGSDKQAFNFLTLGDSNEAPISREKEAAMQAGNLPVCNQLQGHLASLRPVKGGGFQGSNNHHLPLSPLQNIMNVTAAS